MTFSLSAVAAKAPRKSLGASSSGGSSSMTSPTGSKGNKFSGGNIAVIHAAPEWQKSVADFFVKVPSKAKPKDKENVNPENEEEEEAGGSSSTPQRLVISIVCVCSETAQWDQSYTYFPVLSSSSSSI